MNTIESAVPELDLSADVAETDAHRANLRRARRAAAALTQWAESGGPSDLAEPLEYGIRDLLSDLMHLAQRADIDFDDVLIWAGNRYLEECEEELISS